MRKVLPVDDSPDVLCMVQRTLAPLKGEWEMAFADSAEKATIASSFYWTGAFALAGANVV